jgi:NAD+ synthase (glutamine-hydrolysing)
LIPELAITGYAAGSCLKSRFVPEALAVVEKLHARVGKAPVLVGFVDRSEDCGKPFHGAAALLEPAFSPIIQTHGNAGTSGRPLMFPALR